MLRRRDVGDDEQHAPGVPAPTTSGKCPRCLFRDCLCAEIPTLTTRTRVILLRHTDERTRSSNTGRLAHLALPNSEIIDYPNAGPIPSFADAGAALVFPGGPPLATPPRAIIVLDGTWAQARRMYRKLPALRGIPLLALPATMVPAAARFREAPSPAQVSTIEAIAAALSLLEVPGDGASAALLHLFAVACGRAAASGRRVVRSPNLPES